MIEFWAEQTHSMFTLELFLMKVPHIKLQLKRQQKGNYLCTSHGNMKLCQWLEYFEELWARNWIAGWELWMLQVESLEIMHEGLRLGAAVGTTQSTLEEMLCSLISTKTSHTHTLKTAILLTLCYKCKMLKLLSKELSGLMEKLMWSIQTIE